MMPTQEQMKLTIIRKQGQLSSLKSHTRFTDQFLSEKITEAEKEVSEARNMYILAGDFDDCGSFYSDDYTKAQGVLDELNSLKKSMLEAEVQKIKEVAIELKELKLEFKNSFGDKAYNDILDLIKKVGKESHSISMQKQKNRKHLVKSARSILEILLTQDKYGYSFYYHVDDFTKKLIDKIKTKYGDALSKELNKNPEKTDHEARKSILKKVADDNLSLITSTAELIINADISTDYKPMVNHLDVIKLNYEKISKSS